MSPNVAPSRRACLTALGAAVAGLAGCNGPDGSDSGGTGTAPTDDPRSSSRSATPTRTPAATAGTTPDPTPTPDPRLAWSRSFAFGLETPHVTDGQCAFVTWGDWPAVHVVDAATGAERWRRSFAASPRELRWADGDLYVGPGTPDRDDPAGRLHRYDRDGRQVWTTVRAERLPETDGPWSYNALAPLGVDDEHVYAVTKRYDDDHGEGIEGLYAFDRADGSLVWSRSAASGIGRAHRLGDAVVLVGSVGPELQSVAPADGRLRWRRRGSVHDVDAGARVALQDTRGEPGPLHVVDLQTGESRLSVTPPADWVDDRYGMRGLFAQDVGLLVWWAVWRGSTYLAATALDDGTELWARRGDLHPFWTAVVDGTVVIAEEPPDEGGDWALRGLDAATGDLRWRRPLPGAYRLGYAGSVGDAVAVELRLGDGDLYPDPDQDGDGGTDGAGARDTGGVGAGGDGTPDRIAVVDVTDGTTRWARRLADWTDTWATVAGDRLYAGEVAVDEELAPVSGRLRVFAVDGAG